MNLNDENIDELMFQLLEGEIRGEERSKLLDAINADKNYSKLWEAWQQTILDPNDELLVMDSSRLKKSSGRTIMLWWKYAAAAVIVMAVGFTVYYSQKSDSPEMVKNENPVNPKLQIIKVPAIEPANHIKKANDSVISFKQKVQMMVDGSEKKPGQEDEDLKDENLKPGNKELFVENPKQDKMNEVPKPVTNNIKKENEDNPAVKGLPEESGVIMTVYSEGSPKKPKSGILNQAIQDKRNLLSRIFSAPKVKIVNDSNTYTKKKLIIENKEYKIIAGF